MNEEEIVLTPMMKQFLDLKAKHPDAVMLFRCGDFYETYSTDAIVAAEILGITLTKRANGKGKTIEMAGFPHHALDTYLPKLVRAGKRVAICDQLEDPKMTKKLVKRGITELVTPGVSINDNVLNYKENNFLAAVHFGKASCGVAFLDISTGEFLTAEGPFDYIDKLLNNFAPKEILFERGKRLMFEGKSRKTVFSFRNRSGSSVVGNTLTSPLRPCVDEITPTRKYGSIYVFILSPRLTACVQNSGCFHPPPFSELLVKNLHHYFFVFFRGSCLYDTADSLGNPALLADDLAHIRRRHLKLHKNGFLILGFCDNHLVRMLNQ